MYNLSLDKEFTKRNQLLYPDFLLSLQALTTFPPCGCTNIAYAWYMQYDLFYFIYLCVVPPITVSFFFAHIQTVIPWFWLQFLWNAYIFFQLSSCKMILEFCLMQNWVTFPVMLPGNPEACAHAPPQGPPLSSWTLEALARVKCCGCHCPTKAGWCCSKGAGKCFRGSWQHLRLQNLCVQREEMCLNLEKRTLQKEQKPWPRRIGLPCSPYQVFPSSPSV